MWEDLFGLLFEDAELRELGARPRPRLLSRPVLLPDTTEVLDTRNWGFVHSIWCATHTVWCTALHTMCVQYKLRELGARPRP